MHGVHDPQGWEARVGNGQWAQKKVKVRPIVVLGPRTEEIQSALPRPLPQSSNWAKVLNGEQQLRTSIK